MHTRDTFFLTMPHSFPTISDCVPIGKIARPHGNEGFVLINLHHNYTSICKEIEYVFLDIQNKLVPFFIQKCSIKGGATYIQFDDVTTIQLAEKICGFTLYIPSQLVSEEDEESEMHELIGCKLYNNKDFIGTICDVLEYSMNVVLSVETSNEQEILIPFSSELIIELDSEKQLLIMNLPEGIFDL